MCFELSEKVGCEAAKLCAVDVLAQIKAAFGSFELMHLLLRIEGYVSRALGWTDQPKVINGASDLSAKVLGDKAGQPRIALGHNVLRSGAAV